MSVLYRKKPIVIEAHQMPEPGRQWSQGMADFLFSMKREWEHSEYVAGYFNRPGIVIHTLEGDMLASPLDWIIKGIDGEFYPCKPDIFEKTYEKVLDNGE